MGQNILLQEGATAATLTLNRPDKLNPLDHATVKELKAAIEALGDGPPVLVTGAGRAFCAGGDLAGYVGLYQRPDDFRSVVRNAMKQDWSWTRSAAKYEELYRKVKG